MKIKALVLIFGVLARQAWAADKPVDPSGTWSVKAKVGMSTCTDMPMNRATTEQWIINPVGDGYQIQVMGNANQKLIYQADYVTAGGEGAMIGRYVDTNGWNKKGMSDIQIMFAKDKVGGMRIDVRFPEKECSALSALDFKKMD